MANLYEISSAFDTCYVIADDWNAAVLKWREWTLLNDTDFEGEDLEELRSTLQPDAVSLAADDSDARPGLIL